MAQPLSGPGSPLPARPMRRVPWRPVARHHLRGYVFLFPMLALLLIFKLIPMIQAFGLSLTSYDLLTPPRFVGFSNYVALLSDARFLKSIGVTLYYTFGTCIPVWFLSLGLALVFNQALPGKHYLRLAYFLPAVVPVIVFAMIWRFLLHPYGLLNAGLEQVGLPAVDWLTSSAAIIPGFILASEWRFVPYFMVVYLAGLQNIPRELNEAASIDGADAKQRFRYITLPLLRPTILLVMVVSIIMMSKAFTSILGFLRNPIGPEQARVILARRFERRESDFLDLMCRAIFAQAASPYRQLLGLAGCEYGDVERLVSREGVEGALGALHRSGVYLTVDELKGRHDAIRGSARLSVDPAQLRNPGLNVHLTQQTSGSRGRRTPVPVDLAVLRERAVNRCLMIAARGGGDWLHAAWYVPGGDAVTYQLVYSRFGASPARWFSQVDPAAPGLHPRYRWSLRALRWGSRLAGVRLPSPQYVPLDEPLPIARWLADVLSTGRTPHLIAYASPAVRLCQAAFEAGIDLRGAQFSLVGEPVTSARLACVRRAGADALSNYSSIEAGPIGDGCLRPEAPDDVHLYHDLVALIQPARRHDDGLASDGGLFVSSVRPGAPVVLLNVSLGDEAVLTRRRCGCPLERVGWTTHLHTIRSFEKLTAGGMTFFDTDVIQVLDVVLPARFGGGPTDYQLLEEEHADGRPEVRLLVHPRLGSLDTVAVAEAFLEAIGAGDGAERIMALQWRQAGLPRVERRAPRATATGKILHLHQSREAMASRA